MTHQSNNHTRYPELELSLKLSKLESAFKFLDYLNNELDNVPRNTTERNTIKSNLNRAAECRVLLNDIIRKNRVVIADSSSDNDALDEQQYLHGLS